MSAREELRRLLGEANEATSFLHDAQKYGVDDVAEAALKLLRARAAIVRAAGCAFGSGLVA